MTKIIKFFQHRFVIKPCHRKIFGYFVLTGWILISFPSVYYIVSNIWIASLFPAIGSLIVVTVSAVFEMSEGSFLQIYLSKCSYSLGLFFLFKIAYDKYGADLDFCHKSLLQALFSFGYVLLLWCPTRNSIRGSLFFSSHLSDLYVSNQRTVKSKLQKMANRLLFKTFYQQSNRLISGKLIALFPG